MKLHALERVLIYQLERYIWMDKVKYETIRNTMVIREKWESMWIIEKDGVLLQTSITKEKGKTVGNNNPLNTFRKEWDPPKKIRNTWFLQMFEVEPEKMTQDISRNCLGKRRGNTGTPKSNITYFNQNILHTYLRFIFKSVFMATYKDKRIFTILLESQIKLKV
jgi:hypothetical protein